MSGTSDIILYDHSVSFLCSSVVNSLKFFLGQPAVVYLGSTHVTIDEVKFRFEHWHGLASRLNMSEHHHRKWNPTIERTLNHRQKSFYIVHSLPFVSVGKCTKKKRLNLPVRFVFLFALSPRDPTI